MLTKWGVVLSFQAKAFPSLCSWTMEQPIATLGGGIVSSMLPSASVLPKVSVHRQRKPTAWKIELNTTGKTHTEKKIGCMLPPATKRKRGSTNQWLEEHRTWGSRGYCSGSMFQGWELSTNLGFTSSKCSETWNPLGWHMTFHHRSWYHLKTVVMRSDWSCSIWPALLSVIGGGEWVLNVSPGKSNRHKTMLFLSKHCSIKCKTTLPPPSDRSTWTSIFTFSEKR